jgi:8-oxo-dGTP pyrophosphatase MutT (NUDIX family)
MKNSCTEQTSLLILKKFIKEVVGDYSMAGSRRNDAPGNIRSGMQVIGYHGNVLSDEEHAVEIQSIRPTVRILISRSDGKILSIVDPNDSFYIGLPGGGIESGESEEEAAKRELWEETGLKSENMVELGKYLIDIGPVTFFRALDFKGVLRNSHEGNVTWVNPTDLLNGRFGKYYKEIFRDIGVL